MKQRVNLKLLILPTVIILSSCGGGYSTQVKTPSENLISQSVATTGPSSFLKVTYPSESIANQLVSPVNLQGVALQNAIESAIPNVSIVPLDANVDLSKAVSIKANKITVATLLQQLTGLTDYHFELKGNVIKVSSLQTKQWNISALATKRQGKASVGQAIAGSSNNDQSSGNTSTQQSVDFNDDYWHALLKNARSIVGLSSNVEGANKLAQQKSNKDHVKKNVVKPYVVGSRVNGLVMAAASPSRIERLDKWINKQIQHSTVQFYLDINAYEVVLSDNRGAGIDWSYLKTGDIVNGVRDTINVTGSSPNLIGSSNIYSLGVESKNSESQAKALFRFLQRYGKVSLLTQPNLTITNGKSAFFSSGLEFSYTASISQSQDQQGNVTVTPTIERVKVGVSISITARLLHNNKIALDVVPVITAVEGFEFIEAGNNFKARTPNITLKEMATQVITEPGQPVRLGGLISERLSERATKIPRKGDESAFWDVLFKSQLNELERRELVISITPTLVQS